MRLDIFLVDRKFAVSRTQAQDLIQAGYVFLKKNDNEQPLLKANHQVSEDQYDFVFVKKNELQKYVSRAGLKLEKALTHVNFNTANVIALDIGQSTGGFTDCLLKQGVEKVVGIDVGHEQLHPSLKDHPKIRSFEGIHVKDLSQHSDFINLVPEGGFDLVVADVSFISISKVMPYLVRFLKPQGYYLFLVKPQFELTSKDLDKKGIVKNPESFKIVQKQIEQVARQCFGDVLDYFGSETLGKDGNQEFFIYGCKTN